MIKNRRQAAASRKKREELLSAAAQAPQGQQHSYLELAGEIGAELDEYEAIRDGRRRHFTVNGIDGLGECLIKARLAKGWTQRRLAEALGVSEQAVQRDEERAYENAGLARLAEIADVLGYGLCGMLDPCDDSWRDAVPLAAFSDSPEARTLTPGEPAA